MGKNTFYAIVLCVLIITISFYVQARFFTPVPTTKQAREEQSEKEEASSRFVLPVPREEESGEEKKAEDIVINTDVFTVVLSSKNAVISTLSRKREVNGVRMNVVLIPRNKKEEAFRVLFPGERKEQWDDVFFDVQRLGSKEVLFSRHFVTTDNQRFKLEKHYIFKDNEDVFELRIRLKNEENKELVLGESAYILTFGPQLGPKKEILENTRQGKRAGRRWFSALLGNKLKNIGKVRPGRERVKNDRYTWSGISGRYFSMMILTNSARYTTIFSAEPVEGLSSGSQISLMRPAINSSAIMDSFKVYLGPNTGKQLARYDEEATNAFGISGAQFGKIQPRRLLSILERLFKWLLNSFYRLVPNYGVAIILLTLVVRFVTYPVTRKSKASSERMRELGPKIKQLKERFGDDKWRLNKEITELYRRERISPFGAFLPILIQFPVFIAMYRVIYEDFSLLGQPFVGWINDLSQPDVLVTFGGYTLPIFKWTGIHLLPIIMIGTQFFSGYIIMRQQQQSAHATGKGMMMFLSYGFPFIIFFALYNSPSGLILYWIISNIFTVATMFDKPQRTHSDEKVKGTRKKRAIPTRAHTKRKGKTRRPTLLERLQRYVDENNQQKRR